MATIVVDPFTRIEGHVRVVCEVNVSGNVTNVQNGGTMFRGIENILKTRDPRDAPQIAQRI